MLKIKDLIAHIQKLTPVNSHFHIFMHFRYFVVLNTSYIGLRVQTQTLTTTQAYGMKSVPLNKYRASIHSITLCHIETLSVPTIFALQGLDCMT